jgi:hypothetical protein
MNEWVEYYYPHFTDDKTESWLLDPDYKKLLDDKIEITSQLKRLDWITL